MRALAALSAMLLANPVAAQDVAYSDAPTASCMASIGTGDASVCIGRAADRCMLDTPGGTSTAGMIECAGRELTWWDAQLNIAYKALMAQSKRADAEAGDYAPSQADALRRMQRAWIPFRDTKCAYARSQWGGGTGAGPAGVFCLMEETARQTLFLRASNWDG